MEAAKRLIDEWVRRTEEESVFSPAAVQDLLFELYGDLRDEPVVDLITTWLSLSLERTLFGADELRELLLDIRRQLPVATTA